MLKNTKIKLTPNGLDTEKYTITTSEAFDEYLATNEYLTSNGFNENTDFCLEIAIRGDRTYVYSTNIQQIRQLLAFYFDDNENYFNWYFLFLQTEETDFIPEKGIFIKDGFNSKNYDKKLISKYRKTKGLEKLKIPKWAEDMVPDGILGLIFEALSETDEYIMLNELGNYGYVI